MTWTEYRALLDEWGITNPAVIDYLEMIWLDAETVRVLNEEIDWYER